MNKKQQIIEVLTYDPNWPTLYQDESIQLSTIFAHTFIRIHHIGSTAIPNMAAKPTIDMLMEVHDITQVDQFNEPMSQFGYENWGEYHFPQSRFFVKGENKRSHHLHVFERDSDEIHRHLVLRDYLITQPQEARLYAQLKQSLAKEHRHNRRAYALEKKAYVTALKARALKSNSS